MFEDYVQSGEDWFRSSLLLNATQSHKNRQRGVHRMMSVKDIREKFGVAIAASIVKEKKALQDAKRPEDPNVYYMAHPEAPDSEES